MKYLIVGLGNIGAEYANTRHNIGFVVADAIAQTVECKFEPGRYGDMARFKYRARNILLLKPSTYMNLSGNAIKYWLNKENIPTEKMLVIVDDLALPTGTLRLRSKGGDGGHNGLSSIIGEIGTTQFPRLRVGIGNEFSRGQQIDHVLGQWSKDEEALMIPAVKKSVEIIKSYIHIGIGRTMNTFNTKS